MKKRVWSIFLCLILVFSLSFSTFAMDEMTDEEYQNQIAENAANMGISVEEYTELLQNAMFKYYKSYMEDIAENYKFGISMEELYELTIKGLIGVNRGRLELAFASVFEGLDVNSQYFDKNTYASFTQKLDDSMYGVGIVVTNLEDRIVVTDFPIENSPAELAGVCVGDELISVDGRNVKGMSVNEIAPFIRGTLGSTVVLEFLRGEETYSVTLIRVEIKQNAVSYEYLDGNILYLELSTFNQGCADEVKKVLEEADSKHVKKVILDLRNNSGGLGSEAFAIASLFLPKNMMIATMEYKDESRNEVHKSTAKFKEKKYETVVLVNEYSASASELLAAAFQDNEMGVLIGTNTYGKGSGQQVYALTAFNSGYKLTVCQYRTPDGTLLPATGLKPDIIVENPLVYVNKNKDIPQMTMERKLYLGDSGEDVKACQIRLSMLGYLAGNQDGKFDLRTADAVSEFQKDNGLFPCGDLDNSTQGKLYVVSAPLQATQDDQFRAAIDYFSE